MKDHTGFETYINRLYTDFKFKIIHVIFPLVSLFLSKGSKLFMYNGTFTNVLQTIDLLNFIFFCIYWISCKSFIFSIRFINTWSGS